MPNQNAPTSPRFTGLYRDQVNNKIELYYNGTLVTSWDASTTTVPSSQTETNAGVTNFTGTASFTGGTPVGGQAVVERIGTVAAVASNGAGALVSDIQWVAPYNCRIVSAWAANISASDVTVGTATSSASYRRFQLISNTAGTGSGTDIVCSLNATASLGSLATRAFTTVASTIPAGAIVIGSHLTVGAATADGTDMAARIFHIAYQRV